MKNLYLSEDNQILLLEESNSIRTDKIIQEDVHIVHLSDVEVGKLSDNSESMVYKVSTLINEYGTPYGIRWHNPLCKNDGEFVVIEEVEHSNDCYCDSCRGVSSVWEQTEYCRCEVCIRGLDYLPEDTRIHQAGCGCDGCDDKMKKTEHLK